LTQISNSGATDISPRNTFIINLQSFVKTASQPAFAMAVFVLLLGSAGLFSHKLFNQTKPNDSLYIARIVSEKVKLNTVLNQMDRDKMAVQFASNHAQDITNILADPSFDHSNEENVARLNEDFKREMTTVKNRINRLAVAPKEEVVEEESVSIAESSKDENGLEIYEEEATEVEEAVAPEEVVEEDKKDDANKMLEDAEQSFEDKDYDSVLDKLKEMEEIIK